MTKQNFKTPIEKIFFRSSKIGLLAGGLVRFGLTERQHERMKELQAIKTTPIGLTDKQAENLAEWDLKIKEGGSIAPSLMAKRDEFKRRLVEFKELTPKQEEELQKLIEQDNKEPELSQGAKTFVKEVWLQNEKGFYEEVTDKKLRKGLQAEEDGLNLISYVDDMPYFKNEKKVKKNNISGTCDAKTYIKSIDALVIDDIKCSWNPRTFMSANLSTLYEWQGRAYLYLYDADIFRLRFCLVDCPPDVYQDEFKKFCWQHNIIDPENEEYKELVEQFNRNYLYENSGNYSREERVKTFMFERDLNLEKIMLKAVELAVEYYKTITLNMIEE